MELVLNVSIRLDTLKNDVINADTYTVTQRLKSREESLKMFAEVKKKSKSKRK